MGGTYQQLNRLRTARQSGIINTSVDIVMLLTDYIDSVYGF